MIPELAQCKSPLRPTRYNVVVAIDIVGAKSAGGIIIPKATSEREDGASEKGRVVEVSPMAFKGGDWADEPNPPQAGDVVLFQRYEGKEIKMDEGEVKYRVIPDDAIKGILK